MTFDDISFLIIGAAKSATTSLQHSLQMDASVFMPDPELHYFSREFHRGHAWYLSHFSGAAPGAIAGEKSNSYLDTADAAARIHASLPRTRLIAQLRNPIERAYSDYCMLYRRAEVGKDIGSHLDPRKAAGGRFLLGGLYHDQLLRFYELFPGDQIKVVLFEDFRRDAHAQLNDVRQFVGLSGDTAGAQTKEKVKDKTSPMLSPQLRRQLAWLKPAVAPFRKTAPFEALRRLLARETVYAPLNQELRSRLIDFYAPDVERLGLLLRRDLSQWLTDTPSTAAPGSAA
jgi:Sulfotransferase family